MSRTNPHLRIRPPLHQCYCVFGVAAAIPCNIIALRLARNVISVESLVISLVHVKEEQESKQATDNSQISLMTMQMKKRLQRNAKQHRVCKEVLRSFTPCSRREIEIVRAQINSASTCNTMPSDLLSYLFQRPEAESAHIEAKQCGQKVKYPSLRQKRQTTDNRSSLWRTSRATNHHF